MKTLPVVYSDDARRDLDTIFGIVLEISGSVAIAERYVLRIEEKCRGIGLLPLGGAPRDAIIEGMRIVPLRKRVVIAYIVEADAVVITNVFYSGEDYQAIQRGGRPERWKP